MEDTSLAAEALALVQRDQPFSEAVSQLAALRQRAREGRVDTDEAAGELDGDEKTNIWHAAIAIHLRNPEHHPPDRFPDVLLQVKKAYLNYRGTGPGPMPPEKEWTWSYAVRLSRSPGELPEALAWVEQARREFGLSDEDIS